MKTISEMPVGQAQSVIGRVQSVDILRGAVMVIMAIDHVRVFSGELPGGASAGIFFTRWITHFCAPAFAFFTGVSAFLYFKKSGNKQDLATFLVTRGILLVILELTVVRFLWTFNFEYANFVHTNIIWALGWAMIFLACFIHLKPLTIAIIGLVLIFTQQVFAYVPLLFPCSFQESAASIWGFFYPSLSAGNSVEILPGIALPTVFGISILYVILPWLGVVMTGFSFGKLLTLEFSTLRKICLYLGVISIVIFTGWATLQALDIKTNVPFLFKLLGQKKYPPSQLYLLMTLGPVIALIPWAEKIKGRIADILKTFGRVPLFYYLVHLLVIHLSAFIVNLILYGSIHNEWYATSPLVLISKEVRWGLSILYLVWIIDIIPLYFICKWYAQYKANHPEKNWIKYL